MARSSSRPSAAPPGGTTQARRVPFRLGSESRENLRLLWLTAGGIAALASLMGTAVALLLL